MKKELINKNIARLKIPGTCFRHKLGNIGKVIKVEDSNVGCLVTVEYAYAPNANSVKPFTRARSSWVGDLARHSLAEFVDASVYNEHHMKIFTQPTAVVQTLPNTAGLLNELRTIRVQNIEILDKIASNDARIVEIERLIGGTPQLRGVG